MHMGRWNKGLTAETDARIRLAGRRVAHALKGRPKSHEHVEAVRSALFDYYDRNGGGLPSFKKGLRAWDDKRIAYNSFRCRQLSKRICKQLVKEMFSLPVNERKAFFLATKDTKSHLYATGNRHVSATQKAYYRELYTGGYKSSVANADYNARREARARQDGKSPFGSVEDKAKKRHAALHNLMSGKTKPSASSFKGHFFSKKNNELFRYRSSWELRVMEEMEKAANIASYKPEPFFVRYMFAGKESIYFPDFLVTFTNGVLFAVEVKPKHLLKDARVKVKLRTLRWYCQSKGMNLLVLTENEIFSKELLSYFQTKVS
jgi:hypothetical protein